MSSKVLVADDSSVMRTIITRSLNTIGIHDVVQAADGNEALQRFADRNIDVVFTEWNMRGKTGLEVLKAIRSQGSDVPVVMITIESGKSRVFEAIQAGATDYLAKPFDADTLKEKLQKYVTL